MMRIKKYQTASLDEALRQIRGELGRDAVILETRRVRAPGLRGLFVPAMLEVTAVADESGDVRVPWDALSRMRSEAPHPARMQTREPLALAATEAAAAYTPAAARFEPGLPVTPQPARRTVAPAPLNPSADVGEERDAPATAARVTSLPALRGPSSDTVQLFEALSQVREALATLGQAQAHILRQVAEGPITCPIERHGLPQFGAAPAPQPEPAPTPGRDATELIAGGVRQGLHWELAEQLANATLAGLPPGASTDDQRMALERALAQAVRVAPAGALQGDPGEVVFLVGGTGMGKTTASARLSSQLAAQGERVALVMLGHSGFTGTSQLVAHCVRQGVLFRDCPDVAALETFLAEHQDDLDRVIVDSRGMNCSDQAAPDTVRSFRSVAGTVRVLLVASTSTHGSVLQDMLRTIGPAQVDGLVVTKLDEHGLLGSIVSAAIRLALPLWYLSTGSELHDGMHPATASEVAALVLGSASVATAVEMAES